MPAVKVKENEPFDVALRRFKRSCEKAGILAEVRRREFYEKPTSVRKRQAAAAVKRHMKKVSREQRSISWLSKYRYTVLKPQLHCSCGFCRLDNKNPIRHSLWQAVFHKHLSTN